MRKIFLAVAAMAMLATACTKDDAVSGGNESLVSFTIDSPELMTRVTDGNGESTNDLQYAFYDENGKILTALTGEVANFVGSTTINIALVEGRTYSALFWADNTEAPYAVNLEYKTMAITATEFDGNADKYDAFYKYETNIDPAKKTHKIELTRPFAQINIATADKTAAASAGFDAAATQVTVKAHSTLDLATGAVATDDYATFTYKWATLPTDPATATVGGKSYDMLSMNYVLVNDRELVDVKMEVSEATAGDNAIERNYTTVPVQRNYRTYIVGNLLTTTNEFNVTTVPGFNPNDEIYYVWDGSELTKPAYDESTKTYTITKASELAWISALTNGTLPATMRSTEYAPAESINGCTIVLGDDLDFGGNEFTPINNVSGINFDGKNFAIKNITYAMGKSYATMFENASKSTFKDIKFENVKANATGSGRAGTLVGYFTGGTIENVDVKDVELIGFQKLGGLLAYITQDSGDDVLIKDCTVENVKISANESGEVYQAGGLLGYISSSSNATITIENCEVKGSIIINDTPELEDPASFNFYSGAFIGSIGSSKTADKVVTINLNNCKVGTLSATPALSVSPRGHELFADCTTNGFDLDGRYPNIINIDGEQFVYKTASQKAFEAAIAEGGEVKLTEDVELVVPIEIAEGADVTIDLNGKNFTNNTSNGYAFYNENGGTLRITDTQNSGAVQGVVYTGANSTTIVDGGTFNAAEGGKYVFLNSEGELTINGATINGGSSYPVYSYNPNSKLVINDATVNASFGCINSYGPNAAVEINGGTFNMTGVQGTTSHIAYFSNVDVTINGGNFNKTGDINMSGTRGGGICVINGANLTIEGGNFAGDYADLYDWGGNKNTVIIKAGTFKFNPTAAWIAEGYKAVNANGKYMVVAESVSEDAIVSDAAGLSAAINNGGEAFLTGDITYSSAINSDANINLNGNTFEATKTLNLGNNADLTMVGGNYEVNGTFGHVDVRPTTAEGSVVVFEGVDFSYNKLDPTNGPSTNRLGSVVEVCADVANANTKILFKNCTFANAQVVFEGQSDKTGTFEAEFIDCTFNALTYSAPIYVNNYVEGTIKMTGCTFNLTCTSSTASAVYVSSSTSTAVTVTATNNTLNAVAATPYTFDASKGETEVHNIKVNGTPKDIKLIRIDNSSTTSSATETGTVKSGIAI